MSQVYISTGAFKTNDLNQILELCVRNGIDRLELSSGVRFAEGILDRVRHYHRRPMAYLVHNYFPPHKEPFVLNLASTDLVIRERTLNHCRTAIDLATELGTPFYSVHAGAAMNARPEDLGKPLTHRITGDTEKAYSVFVESTAILAHYAYSRGVKLLIENHVVAPFNLLDGKNTFAFSSTVEDILAFMADVKSKNVGMLIDVGHLKVTANSLGFDPYKFVERVAPHIDAFHLSDNDGLSDQNLPFDRSAWFMEVIGDYPHAVFVIESYGLELEEILACRDAVLEILR